VISSGVVKVDGAVVWLFIVAAAACRKLDPCQCCVFTRYFSVCIDVGLPLVSSSQYFDLTSPNPRLSRFWISARNLLGVSLFRGSNYFVTPAEVNYVCVIVFDAVLFTSDICNFEFF